MKSTLIDLVIWNFTQESRYYAILGHAMQRSHFERLESLKDCAAIWFLRRLEMHAFVSENGYSAKYRLVPIVGNVGSAFHGHHIAFGSIGGGSWRFIGSPVDTVSEIFVLMRICLVLVPFKQRHYLFTPSSPERWDQDFRFFCEILVCSPQEPSQSNSRFSHKRALNTCVCPPSIVPCFMSLQYSEYKYGQDSASLKLLDTYGLIFSRELGGI
jgi:hypothetical protein